MTHILCLICHTIADPLCSCENVGCITDIDKHHNVYVDDITTCRRVEIYKQDGVEVYRELLSPFTDAIYVDYKSVRDSHITFKKIPKKRVKKENNFNTRLRNFLTIYANRTASNNRVGTTYQKQKRRLK